MAGRFTRTVPRCTGGTVAMRGVVSISRTGGVTVRSVSSVEFSRERKRALIAVKECIPRGNCRSTVGTNEVLLSVNISFS